MSAPGGKEGPRRWCADSTMWRKRRLQTRFNGVSKQSSRMRVCPSQQDGAGSPAGMASEY